MVPSNPILTKELSKYTLDAVNPGLLRIPLDSFAANNAEKDVKLSIDGKKIALGLREAGDENLGGYEVAPTLQERKTRLENEIQNISNMKSKIELQLIDGFQPVRDLDDVDTAMFNESSLVAITHMGKRIQELLEFNVKMTLHLNNLMNYIEGDWKESKLAHAISYWQTKLIHAKNAVAELLESVDKVRYIVACLNRTELNYIRGTRSIIYLAQQENYICLRETVEVDDQTKHLHPKTIKQRTEQWFELRKESRVTGSTLFRALGLGKLMEQQEFTF